MLGSLPTLPRPFPGAFGGRVQPRKVSESKHMPWQCQWTAWRAWCPAQVASRARETMHRLAITSGVGSTPPPQSRTLRGNAAGTARSLDRWHGMAPPRHLALSQGLVSRLHTFTAAARWPALSPLTRGPGTRSELTTCPRIQGKEGWVGWWLLDWTGRPAVLQRSQLLLACLLGDAKTRSTRARLSSLLRLSLERWRVW